MTEMNMNNKSMFNLENKLSTMLKPVRPDPAFVNGLKTKLVKTPAVLMEKSRKRIGIMILSTGLLAGALAVWVISILTKFRKG